MKIFFTCLSTFKPKTLTSGLKVRFDGFNLHTASKGVVTDFSNYSTSSNERNRLYTFGLTEHGALGLKKEGSDSSRLRRYLARPIRHLFAEENCVSDVACGFGFTAIAVNSKDTFKVYGCGINTDRQISGDNYELLHCPYPINLGLQNPETKVICLSAGRAHLAVATDEEGVFLLGSNCYGQCGRPIEQDERNEGAFVVNSIKELNEAKVTHVCCGQDHTLFLTDCGEVFSCGWGADGQTGQGNTENICLPTKVKGDIDGETIVRVTGRSDTVLALNDDGEVFGWGNSEYLQLSPSKEIQQINAPCHLKHLSRLGKIVDIAAGGSFCMVLTEGGDVYVWGYGILGAGPEVQKSNLPILLPRTLFGCNDAAPEVKVVQIDCGLTYMVAINSCSHMYSWGHNKHGCLGIGHIRDQYFPYKVALSSLALKVSCGVDHTMVLGKSFG